MKEPYIIAYETFENSKFEISFLEAITSNFVSKKIRFNMYAIKNDEELSCLEIYDIIKSELIPKPSFIVFKMEDFYGSFDNDAVDWIKDNFPKLKLIE